MGNEVFRAIVKAMKTHIQFLLTVQLVTALIYYLLIILFSLGDGFSALTGCLASLLPNMYFSYKMLQQADNDKAAEWLSYAYRSDISKWLMAVLIFALAFTSDYPWDPVILFVGYLVVQMSGIFVPFIDKGN